MHAHADAGPLNTMTFFYEAAMHLRLPNFIVGFFAHDLLDKQEQLPVRDVRVNVETELFDVVSDRPGSHTVRLCHFLLRHCLGDASLDALQPGLLGDTALSF
jgi:hypothetical protein